MTRKELEQVVSGGGSVLHEGKLHTRIDTLPSKARMAKSDEDRAAAAGDLDAQIAALQAQRAALDAGKTAKTAAGGGDDGGGGDADDAETTESLMKNTREKLVEIAKERKIEIGEQDTKAQIVEAVLTAGKE